MAATANRLRDDTCERDWIWEREIEAAPWEETRRLSVGAWERQFRRLRESSPFYATGSHEHSSVLTTFGAGPFVAGHTHFVLLRIGSRSIPVAPGDTERVVFGLRAGLADTLLCTASFAQYLANRSPSPASAGEGRGEGRSSLTHVGTGGEPGGGSPEVRDHIQRVIGVTV